MAYEYVILRGAQNDYRGIVEYLLDVKRSPQAARRFVDEFDRQLGIVCDNPLLHALSRMPELASLGYRSFFVNKYIVLYAFRDDRVVVAHVLHQTQDYARLVMSRELE
ncbi:type II toxin-antitoxin system RelE/ParE family toxin [Paraeggerthella hongkongensis]|uniref:type II toxin-antitoxin system RelE/ParE family toxin n=1 Tax=unclassified Paraeggerthella TaxID=2641972 RepID=UPI000DF7F71D|nr:type II toxin-antitoxin system RelE/ParE family toxin [Paraeggerthella hongkongensis]